MSFYSFYHAASTNHLQNLVNLYVVSVWRCAALLITCWIWSNGLSNASNKQMIFLEHISVLNGHTQRWFEKPAVTVPSRLHPPVSPIALQLCLARVFVVSTHWIVQTGMVLHLYFPVPVLSHFQQHTPAWLLHDCQIFCLSVEKSIWSGLFVLLTAPRPKFKFK